MILTTKGIMPDNGGIGNQWFNDRAGIHARTLGDAARVLDAIRDPETGYFDPRDPFTAIPDELVPEAPYASFAISDPAVAGDAQPLAGMRIAILREHMVKATRNHEAISDQIDAEIKQVLRDQLGAELIETIAAGYPDDPDVPNLSYTFADALAELLPRFMPEIFSRRDETGKLWFDVPGHDVTSYEYLVRLGTGHAPLTPAVNIVNFEDFAAIPCHNGLCSDNVMGLDRYLALRGDERIVDWAAWVANAKFRQSASVAGARNWLEFEGHTAAGKADRLARSYVARYALMKVMYENGIDAFVHPENTVPTPKIGGPNVGMHSLDGITPFFQIPRVVVPAGTTDVIVEPEYALTEDRRDYVAVLAPDAPESRLEKPLPISITFFAGQGDEPTLIRIGTAYEGATHHRFAPPDFGPVTAGGHGHE
jgi:Asp-tRNA(Asn)/Glu-tRNA(Gln) amidotransferase A subunit family amidase